MAAAFAPPPSLVQYEAPLPVGEEGAVKPKAGAGAGKVSEAHTEEILNSILPPRCVTMTPPTLSFCVRCADSTQTGPGPAAGPVAVVTHSLLCWVCLCACGVVAVGGVCVGGGGWGGEVVG
jgi:hypothetical protein